MINNTCFVEVNTVLKQMDSKDIIKIPKDVMETIKRKANNQQIDIDNDRELEKQISKEALSILTFIMLKYVANNEQKGQLKNSLTQNQIQHEKQQVPIKDINEIFDRKKMTKELAVIEKDSFIKKIIKSIINFFKRRV